MASFNKVILMGNLTRDPELRYTASGQAVASIGLAVNRVYKTSSGEKREDTCFVDCTAWARSAEIICEYKRKGDPLLVEGRLQYDTWEDRDTGKTRSKLKVVIENFQFISRGSGGAGGGGGRSYGGSDRGGAQPSGRDEGGMEPLSDDDIPF